MNRSVPWASSLLLLLLAATIAAAVNHFIPSEDGLRIARADSYGNSAIQTGSLVYPRTAIDSDSFSVQIARPARRIVSQYWAIDEFVYSVVPPERVVAVSELAYRAGASNVFAQVQRYHPAIATDPEQVLRLDPDLLLVSNSSRADFCALVRSAHVPIYRMFTMFTTLEQVAETIGLTGYLTGEDQTADEQINQFWTEINRAQARRPPNSPRPRILGLGGNSTYGSETLFNDIIRTLGGINVGAEGGLKGYAQVNSEQIVRWNPEWIVAGADKGQTRRVLASLMADPGIALTQAARNGHIVVLDYNVFLPTSPYTTLLVTAISKALYG